MSESDIVLLHGSWNFIHRRYLKKKKNPYLLILKKDFYIIYY